MPSGQLYSAWKIDLRPILIVAKGCGKRTRYMLVGEKKETDFFFTYHAFKLIAQLVIFSIKKARFTPRVESLN